MENESLKSMTFVGLENIRYINLQNAQHVEIKRQAFLKTKAKHGIVQVV